jgi:hypothetical protein
MDQDSAPSAWVWSEYKGVLSARESGAPLGNEASAPLAWVWSQYQGEASQTQSESEGTSQRTTIKRGIILLVGVLSGFMSAWLSVLLLTLALFWIAWGWEPRRTEDFIGRLPMGSFILKAATRLNRLLS